MSTNDFLPFGTNSGANVVTQASYAAITARLTGFVAGIALSQQVNKPLRQATSVASMIGDFITLNDGGDALDNGDLSTLRQHFEAALAHIIQANLPTGVDLSGYLLKSGGTMTGPLNAPAGFRTSATLLNAAASFGGTDFGKLIEQTATSTVTTTLPSPVGAPGGRFTFWANSVASQTLATPAGAFLGPGASGAATMSVPAGGIYAVESDGFNWILVVHQNLSLATGLPSFSMFETSGTWTRLAGATRALVLLHGAGGAGGGATSAGGNAAGSGGGAGEFRIADLDVSSMASAAVIIGAGGTGAVALQGSAGSDSSFGGLMLAKGGWGGALNAQTGSNISLGGSGGFGGWSFPGSGGGSSQAGTGGTGGAGAFGGGGRAGNSSQGNKNGSPGFRGGGGGGGDGYTAGTAAGGNGGDGWAFVFQF